MTAPEMDRLTAVVSAALGIPPSDVSAATVDTVASWDSLSHLNLVMAIEQEFDIFFDAGEIPELGSFERIALAIDRVRRNGGLRCEPAS